MKMYCGSIIKLPSIFLLKTTLAMDMLTLVRRRCGTFVRQIDVFAVNLAQCTQRGFYHFYAYGEEWL